MSDTTYIDFQAPAVNAAWLNDVNITTYRALGTGGVAPSTPANIIANLSLVTTTTLAQGTGAAGVGYQPSFTGPGLRSQAAKNQETISLADFAGADPTGVTTSDVAVTNFLLACAGGEGLIPPGNWKFASPHPVADGTTLRFLGATARVICTGAGAFQVYSAKNVTFERPYIDMTGASAGAVAIDIQGAWFTTINRPYIVGSGVGNNQVGISMVSSKLGNLSFGCYCTEIINPFINTCTYAIKSDKQTGDTVKNTELTIRKGWSNGCAYGAYLRYVDSFNVEDYTPEGGTTGLDIDYCTSGYIRLGEIDCSGYGLVPGANCAYIYWFAPSLAGTTSVANHINTASFTPVQVRSDGVRLFGSNSTANLTYTYGLQSQVNYGQSLVEFVNGGGTQRNLRVYDDVGLQRIYNVGGLSGTNTPSKNLSGTATFAASTTVTVTFAIAETDTSYRIVHGGNAAGYVSVSAKTTAGFTLTCSASNSNAVDWMLVR